MGTVSIPFIDHGRATLSGEGWQRVLFNRQFAAPPSVIAVGEQRVGWYQPQRFEPKVFGLPAPIKLDLPTLTFPKVTVAALTLPAFSIKFSPTIPDFRTTLAKAAQKQVVDYINSILPVFPVPINLIAGWLRDAVYGPLAYHAGYASGANINTVLAWVRDQIRAEVVTPLNNQLATYQKQLNDFAADVRLKVQESINKTLQEMQTKVNTAFDTTETQINSYVVDTHKRLEGGVNEAITAASAALNNSIDMMWDMVGLEKGKIPSLIEIQNVGTDGFDVKCPGDLNLHWIAMYGYQNFEFTGDGVPPAVDPFERLKGLFQF